MAEAGERIIIYEGGCLKQEFLKRGRLLKHNERKESLKTLLFFWARSRFVLHGIYFYGFYGYIVIVWKINMGAL